jgi:hypothetical protein
MINTAVHADEKAWQLPAPTEMSSAALEKRGQTKKKYPIFKLPR